MKRVILSIGGLTLLFFVTFAALYFGIEILESYGVELVNRPLNYDYVLKNGTIVDGTGKLRYQADIGIKRGRIAFIGIIEPPAKVKVVDASGLLILPGFVDLYSRLDGTADSREAFEGLIKQGITTVLSGHGSLAQEDVFLHLQQAAKSGLPVNYGVLADHQGLFNLLKPQEPNQEADDMEGPLEFGQLPVPAKQNPKPNLEELLWELHKSLEQGAFGLAVGLDDELGRQLTYDEVLALAKVLEERGAILSLTLPESSPNPDRLLHRILELHQKTKTRILLSPWGYLGTASDTKIAEMETELKAAYQSSRNLYTCLYPSPRQPSGLRQTLQRALSRYPAHMIEIVDVGGQNPRTLIGKTLAELAQERGMSASGVAKDLMSAGLVQVTLRMSNQDRIIRLAADPFVVLTVDSGLGKGAQYSSEALKEFLGRYVQGQNLITWEEVALKLAARPSALLGIEDRGTIKNGNWADLVLIDPTLLLPQSQTKKSGIRHVFVNGSLVYSKGKMPPQGQGQGQLLRFKAKPLMPEPLPEPKIKPVPGVLDEEEEEG